MARRLEQAPQLADLLQDHHDQLAEGWAARLRTLPRSGFARYTTPEVAQRASAGVEAIVDALRTGSPAACAAYLERMVSTCMQADLGSAEVIEGLLTFQEVAQPLIWRTYAADLPQAQLAISQLDACLRTMVGRLGHLCAQAMQERAARLAAKNAELYREASRRLAELQSLQRTTAALLQRTKLDDVLAIVCAEAQQLTQATGSAALLREGETWLQVMASTGTPAPSLARISLEESFAGSALQKGKPLLLNNPRREMQAYYRNPEVESLLAVPLSVNGDLIGALDVVNKPGGFSQEDVRIMMLFADPVALAIETSRLHQQAQQLAITEERHRLARELHDSVTQALYSVTLYTDAARMALASGKQAAVAEYLDELRSMVRQAMLDMRLLIFELHPPALEVEGLVAALQTRLEAVEVRAGVQAQFDVDGESRLPLAVENELYRIAQEALNNVAKHAHAQHVTVHLQFKPTSVRLDIQDDGVGFDPATARQTGGFGLCSIEERVRRVGGDLTVESAPGAGTALHIVIPNAERTSVEGRRQHGKLGESHASGHQ